MSTPKPRHGHKMPRSEELKIEDHLGIEGPFRELKLPAFRFFALPREIRDQVYVHLFTEPEGKRVYNLSKFKDPPIMLASKQTRREARPICVAECSWSITIPFTNPDDSVSSKIVAEQFGRSPRGYSSIGAAEDTGFFRDIVFEIVEVMRRWMYFPGRSPFIIGKTIASIHIKTHPSSEFLITRHAGVFLSSKAHVHLEDILAAAEAGAEKLQVRKDFKGYTVHELKDIARAFTGAIAPPLGDHVAVRPGS